jgi:hypothetical protein
MGRATGVFSRVSSAFFYLLNGKLQCPFDQIVLPGITIGLKPYGITDWIYRNQKDISAMSSTDGRAIVVNNNGSIVFMIISTDGSPVLVRYDVPDPWDMSSITGETQTTGLSINYANALAFNYEAYKKDEDQIITDLFTINSSSVIQRYNFGMYPDITSLSREESYDISSYLLNGGEPYGIAWSGDGAHIYIADGNSPRPVFEWNVTPNGSISNLQRNADHELSSVDYEGDSPVDMYVTNDGKKVYFLYKNWNLAEWEMTTPHDISTATKLSVKNLDEDSPAWTDSNCISFTFNSFGTRMLILGRDGFDPANLNKLDKGEGVIYR